MSNAQKVDRITSAARRRRWSRAAFAMGAASSFVACARRRPAAHEFRVAMVTDTGGLGDRSFNDSAYAGLRAAQRTLGIRTILVQSRAPLDYQTNLSLTASTGYDETIAVGYMLERDLAEVARRFPSSRFTIIDGTVDAPNVTSIGFREQEASFLAGALAALVTRSRTLAFLGGIDVPELRKFEAGFRAGAQTIDSVIRVLVKYIGSYDDVAAGRELSGVLYEQGADIIFAAAGKAGLGTIDESRRRPGTYAVGVDSDQDGVLPGKVLTSVLKRIDASVLRVCREAQGQTLRPGRVSLGLKEGAVGLTDFRYTRSVVTPARIAVLERLRAAIVRGSIDVPFTREQLHQTRGRIE